MRIVVMLVHYNAIDRIKNMTRYNKSHRPLKNIISL